MSKTFAERAAEAINPLTKRLFTIIEEKKTNLCLAADVRPSGELLNLAKLLGPHICILKVHHDHYPDFPNIQDQLVALSRQFNFLIFNDRKFSDGPDCDCVTYETMIEYANLVTIHGTSSKRLDSLMDVAKNYHEPRGILVVCETSYDDTSYRDQANRDQALQLAKDNKSAVVGVIAQKMFIDDGSLIKLTPGVHMSATGSDRGQNWRTPESVMESGSDIIIVGRGITSAPTDDAKLALALEYKKRCFDYLIATKRV